MTTLEAIGFTMAGGAACTMMSFAFFGVVVGTRSVYIAPRCTARPRNVIYNPNPLAHIHPQNRGSPMFGWISWCNALSYDQLLRGVPGTGTRKGGLKGSLLKVNLDGIVLLRYHAICMRITVVAAILCLTVVLPLNLSSRCWNLDQGGVLALEHCGIATYNLTNYERTTLANIPALSEFTEDPLGRSGTLGRLYGIVFCTWFIMTYACIAIQREWIEMLALRRVYYLEFNHWRERKRELQQTLLQEYDESDCSSVCSGDHEKVNKEPKKSDDPVRVRDPWIPHPEQRETVPNISLYSVLVGGLPAAPKDEVNEDDVEAAVKSSKRQNIDWQLTFAGEYFDRCVPNQPGYSSSIAAITILPSASDLARAWAKWYKAAAKLRKLRYIRSLIRKRVHYDILDEEEDQNEKDDADDREFELPGAMQNPALNRTVSWSTSGVNDFTRSRSRRPSAGEESKATPRGRSASAERATSAIYELSAENKGYYQDVLGSSYDGDVDQGNIFMSFEFGPEQTAVYSREFAQSAAACCPHGCFEGRLARLGIDDLRELEETAKEQIHTANLLLRQAQKHAIISPHNLEAPMPDTAAASHERSIPDDINQCERSESYRSFFLSSNPGSYRNRKNGKEKVKFRTSRNWDLVDSIVNDPANDTIMDRVRRRRGTKRVDNGVVDFKECFKQCGGDNLPAASSDTGKSFAPAPVMDTLARESTYAVVTFTSRQAACAARQCLADGRALDRWTTFEDIPIPPLADAAPFALCPCRGCCRPVTISLNDKQKLLRYYFSLLIVITIYIFYTIPLTFATSLINPSKLDELIPGYSKWVGENFWLSNVFSGILPALIWTTFFAMCPTMFKTIANFGSNAHSVYKAELKAMQYYWWFLVLTAFTGSSLANMVIQGFNEGIRIGSEAQKVLANVAATIPTIISATWLNWIIVRATITLPLQYLIQLNSYLFTSLGWKCCSRINRGGGPGGPVPYRVYIDSGVVLLCALALGPAAPLVTPFALIYFLFCWPLMRRNLIFVYRPNYDSGGSHWPFLFEIIMSSMFTAQLLVTTMMALKKAVGPAVLAALPFVPLFFFRIIMRRRFLQPYLDTSLYTSSSLDGWDIDAPTSMDRREEFRRFLVDAHKAAYVPVCLASSAEVLTIEPAIVVTSEHDINHTHNAPPVKTISPKKKKKSKRSSPNNDKSSSTISTAGSQASQRQPRAMTRSKSDEGHIHVPAREEKDTAVPKEDFFPGFDGGFKRRLVPLKGVDMERVSSLRRSRRDSTTSRSPVHSNGRRSSLAQTDNQFGVSLRRIAPHYQNQVSIHDDGSVSSNFHPLTPSRKYGHSRSFDSIDDE